MLKLTVSVLALVAVSMAASSKVAPALQSVFETKEKADVMVILKDSITPILNQISSRSYSTLGEKRTAIRSGLVDFTEASQADILAFLNNRVAEPEKTVRGYWITNKISIVGATADLVNELAANFDEIAEIRESLVIPLEEPIQSTANEVNNETIAWGIERVRAPAAWAQGYEGEGIVVANIDTGVRWNHESLVDNQRPEYSWFDPYALTNVSLDFQGHGTHTMGTICGKNGIGVAPKAQWIACKGCELIACSEDALTRCGQWVACPTLPDETAPNCDLSPSVSSNSWGGGQGNTFYNDIINTWRQGGIVPVFAIGNSGPFCRTANSPGDQLNLISVGATNNLDNVAVFSSHGPAFEDINRVKPEFSAPGVDIYSASHTAVNAYTLLSGTSMSCPHVAGAVAVLLSKNPDLTFDEIETALYFTTDQPPIDETPCGNVTDFWPNNSYGWGIMDVSRAVDVIS